MARERYTADEVATAVRASDGLLSRAASRLGCDRSTVERYADRYASVRDAVREARCATLDVAEQQLVANIKKGDQRAIEFLLRTLGKDRGYVERREITGADGEVPLVIRVIYDDAGTAPSETARRPAPGDPDGE